MVDNFNPTVSLTATCWGHRCIIACTGRGQGTEFEIFYFLYNCQPSVRPRLGFRPWMLAACGAWSTSWVRGKNSWCKEGQDVFPNRDQYPLLPQRRMFLPLGLSFLSCFFLMDRNLLFGNELIWLVPVMWQTKVLRGKPVVLIQKTNAISFTPSNTPKSGMSSQHIQ